MVKGDIVLIPFPFTNLKGSKLRPAVILINNEMDITVCFITSQVDRREPADVILLPNQLNGLKVSSLIRTSKMATLDRSLAKGLLGRLSIDEIADLNLKLKMLLQLT
ncbi:type II toxin-antitoxin system PemK/MazF family toxin [Dyadobacter sp. CY261]|uniref:type II toxin-antitoxin system PemK/MazF family toxin n=1 Tax=Dyadobacter sp. CY261 TaxID=2907203 RepID=UPI001F2AC835|nr:type II toxin-antitoxin system PemK/MazF family toxin [Dyadobacter sp. CY261]MCF0074424.1 type II toxin-antitoxin system PemK/MazF family toxin [Dyadobacter sp. CY261]